VRRRPTAVLVCLAIALAGCGTSTSNEVTCEAGDTLVLSAQAVPSATMLPCVMAFPTGWTFGGYVAESGRVRYWMDSDRAGTHAVEVELTEGCDTSRPALIRGSRVSRASKPRPRSILPPGSATSRSRADASR
jgi:hypothetical protein